MVEFSGSFKVAIAVKFPLDCKTTNLRSNRKAARISLTSTRCLSLGSKTLHLAFGNLHFCFSKRFELAREKYRRRDENRQCVAASGQELFIV